MRDDFDIAPFEEPVNVKIEAGAREICNTKEAAELLLYQWPTGETAKRIQARMACMKVFAGSEPPGFAREALMHAAKEARILARP